MSLILSGTDGLSDVDGTAATPAIRGTDANTGIFFPAADTIGFSEGGAEVARFNSSGNFGLGTTAPSSRLTTSGATGTGNGLTIIDTDYSNDTHQIYGNNSLHLSAGTGGAGAILFRTGGSERARFNTTGALVLAGGTTTANGIGITFPATQSASTDANTLDDYEEGTWTPVFNGSTTNPTTTSGTPVGAYIKVGKLVWVSIQMAGIGYTGGSGNLLIAGLPFAASTTNGELVSFYETTNTFPTGKTGLWGYTGNNATSLNLLYAGGTAGTSQVLVSTASSWNMYTTFCYRATA